MFYVMYMLLSVKTIMCYVCIVKCMLDLNVCSSWNSKCMVDNRNQRVERNSYLT